MNRLAGLLCPRSPLRAKALDDSDCVRRLLDCEDADSLAKAIADQAREHLHCQRARLEFGTAMNANVRVPLRRNGHSLEIALVDGRATLHLEFDSGLDQLGLQEEDCAWIDLADQRLREALHLRDLRDEVRAARNDEVLHQALFKIANLAYSNIDLTEMLARIHALVGRLTYAENFFVAFYNAEHDSIRFPYYVDSNDDNGLDPEQEYLASEYASSLTFAVVHQGRSLIGPSIDLRQKLGLGLDFRLGPEAVDWLGVPMLEGDEVRGAVVVQSYDEAHRFNEDDRRLLTFVAQHILASVSRKQARDELEQAVKRRTTELAEANQALRAEVLERQRAQAMQSALYRIAELAGSSSHIEEFYAGVHGAIGELLDARNFFISVLSDDGTALAFPYYIDEHDRPLAYRRLTNGISEWVLRNRRPLLATETELKRLIEAGEMVIFGTLPKCWLGVPLLVEDRSIGLMVVQSYQAEDDYGAAEQEILQFASYHVATAFERVRAKARLVQAHAELEQRVEERTEELKRTNADLNQQIAERLHIESRLQHEALHDALTGLPNRTAILNRLQKALDRYRKDPRRKFAVLFLDLDRFKVVNDSVGHLLGDELLIEAARRITSCVKGSDAVARLGGDEFTILIEDIDTIEDACGVARRVLGTLVDPIRLGEKEIYSSASIGIALINSSYRQPEELLRDADIAMYRAKAHGRQRYELFDEQLRQEALDMLDLESDMRRGLIRNEFEPFLQPIVRLSDGSVLGYEALLRWRHASRGLLLPADFLSVAEDSGNIEQIDWQLYEKVCAAVSGLDDIRTYVGINVSARHFRSPQLVDNLLDLLKAYRVDPSRIRIEVTEGALLQDPDQARLTMLRLRDAGILTSLDDFGTGYSSLSYLHRFPLHALKIDQSFIADLNPDLTGSSAAVVRAIRALAVALDMEVIAEGIETVNQCEALKRLECDIGQGLLFSAPRPVRELSSVA